MVYRKRMRTSRRSRSNRKTYWSAANFTVDGAFQDGSWFCDWIKWPSGSVSDPQQPALYPTAEDETVVRMVISGNAHWNSGVGSGNPSTLYFGIIAFDGGNPTLWSGNSGGSLPTPALIQPPLPFTDSGQDWLIRVPFYAMTPDTGFNTPNPMTTDYTSSRAKRKLPPGTGLLGVLEYLEPFTPAQSNAVQTAIDIRYCLKSGYYGAQVLP